MSPTEVITSRAELLARMGLPADPPERPKRERHIREAAGDRTEAALLSVPHDSLEAPFQAAVKAYAINHGWVVFETRNSKRVAPGDVDLRMFRRRDKRHVWAECKTHRRGSRLTAEQAWVVGGLQAAGFEAYVWRPDDIPAILAVLA